MNINEMTREELVEALQFLKQKGSGLKVSAKGAISVYGLGKWPVTLYASQMVAFLDRGDEIREFIKANADKLAKKGE